MLLGCTLHDRTRPIGLSGCLRLFNGSTASFDAAAAAAAAALTRVLSWMNLLCSAELAVLGCKDANHNICFCVDRSKCGDTHDI
jgi:hypothetical protein